MTIVDKEDYSVDLEYNDQYVIIHIPRAKFKKSVYADMKLKVQEIWEFVKTIGYQGMWVATYDNDTVTQKLATRLGFEYLGKADGFFVYQYKGLE